jgi:type 1 glutamine amidotransferase
MTKNDSGLSRRRLFQGASAAGMLGLADPGLLRSQSESRSASGGVRALALIGDRYHNPDYIRVSLDKVFKELSIPIDYTIQYDQISHSLLEKYQLFLCLRDGMIWPDGYLGPDAYTAYAHNLENQKQFATPKPESWITEEQGAAIQEFVKSGKGFYALHNSSHISLSSKNYREVMGGAYIGHPPLRPFRVQATGDTHPITQGLKSFMVNDEQHYVTYDKDRKYLILESENVDGLGYQELGTKAAAGWAYDYGQGRVVFTAVGHTVHAMWVPEHVELQKRSIRWLLRQL